MLNDLKILLKKNTDILNIIFLQQKKCTCKNGIITTYDKTLGNLNAICKCQYYNNIHVEDYQKKTRLIFSGIDYIKNNIPWEYKILFSENKFTPPSELINLFDDNYHNRKIFFIYGAVGVGKTTILFYLKILAIIKNIELSIFRESDFKIEFGRLITPDKQQFLIIDDLRHFSKYYSNYYYDLFDIIRRTNMKIVLTSNYSFENWCKKFENSDDGIRIFDRAKGIKQEIFLLGESKRAIA